MRIKLLFFGLLFSFICQGQDLISFEISEGYMAGNVNGQNGWITSQSGPNFIENQVVSGENSTDGSNALKLVNEPDFSTQNEPRIGASYPFSPAIDVSIPLIISFDFRIDLDDESDYLFSFGDPNPDVSPQVVGVFISKTRDISVLTNSASDGTGSSIQTDTNTDWSTNQWTNVRFEIDGIIQDVFIDDALVFTGPIATINQNINRGSFEHSNFNSTAFIDNIRINNEVLSTEDLVNSVDEISLKYLTSDKSLVLQSTQNVDNSEIRIYDLTGRLVLTKRFLNQEKSIDLSSLNNDIYIASLMLSKKIVNLKFVKH